MKKIYKVGKWDEDIKGMVSYGCGLKLNWGYKGFWGFCIPFIEKMFKPKAEHKQEKLIIFKEHGIWSLEGGILEKVSRRYRHKKKKFIS